VNISDDDVVLRDTVLLLLLDIASAILLIMLLVYREDYASSTRHMNDYVLSLTQSAFGFLIYNHRMMQYMDNIVELNAEISNILTWLSIMFVIQFFRHASFVKDVGIITETLKVAGGRMLPLFAVFMVVLVVYATLEYMLYGAALSKFSNISSAIATLFLSNFSVNECK
jgi:hypothetical protein